MAPPATAKSSASRHRRAKPATAAVAGTDAMLPNCISVQTTG